ncbi:NrfD/PsrC family molybdoenzyme membrane anchor subunit [Raoultibacter phocaeensis]|uniref:NrfD/PsrC family molybdoenzyme membrane anchor subunit n=1 Tax=Raoultibacter phocaeensis TaxID=2479841 RepID=UPI001117F2F1|nr:NrfD/PsrC family molybdoenzyme membrane anchor subunit [Raoultibacter phocaeensis]
MKTSNAFKVTAAVLGVLTVVGVAAWIYQLMGGLGVTGMNNGTSWGLYITCFMFFVGLSAGGLIVASSASVFHVKEYKKVALPAVILSTVCICLAGMFVLIDLGGVQRIYQLLLSPNVMSPLFWDICVITLYLIINIVYLYFMVSKKADPRKVAIVSRFALPVAILVHSVTAWIFGLQIAREGWYSAIMAPIFVASALDSGLALLILALSGLKKAKLFDVDKKLIANLAGLLATCIAIDAFFVGCELLTVAYPQATGGMALLGEMFTGSTALFFWGEIILGLIIPFCILVFAKNRQKTGLVLFASVCVVVGVFFKRVWLLFTSFIHPNLYGAPGIASGSSKAAHATGAEMWALTGAYAPTWVEIVVVIGVVSLGVLAFMLLSRRFLAQAPKGEADDPASDDCSTTAAQTA